MLLCSVRIRNFRGVKSAEISFDPITVLIGENDCGRSSIIEAIALALGWNSVDTDYCFQPYHLHRPADDTSPGAGSIVVSLDLCESSAGEWQRDGFETLRRALPSVLRRPRQFSLEVTHDWQSVTHWTFRSERDALTDDRAMLAWFRRRMPVFWMREGMISGRRVAAGPAEPVELTDAAVQVRHHYRELLEGTTVDVTAAIEHGAAAAKKLLRSRARLWPGDITTPFSELLEEITGGRKDRPSTASAELFSQQGTAAQRLGLLLITGALLDSGAGRIEPGMSAVALIENPEAHLHPMTLASISSVIERIGGQKIIATHSGTLLERARLSSVRRLTRRDGVVKEWRVPEGVLNADELRRYSYHLRSRRAASSFARCWLLVEGETEYWLIAELARVCGYDLASEGVTCVEFAQCGLSAVLKIARHLGIEWHLLVDGDMAGQCYVQSALEYVESAGHNDRFTLLPERDIEHCFWSFGYENVFRRAAWPHTKPADAHRRERMPAKAVIARAIERYSKPYLAVLLLDAVIDRGPEGVPPPLRHTIERCVQIARRS